MVFLHNLDRLYAGRKIYPDIWPQFLAEQESIIHSPSYDEARKWYEERYHEDYYSTYPLTDYPEGQYPNEQGLGMTLGELFGNVQEQMKSCRLHSDYPYTSTLDDELLCSIYQGRSAETPGKIKIFDGEIPIRWNNPYSDNILDVEIYDWGGEFELRMDYAAHRYKSESMERFADIYVRIIHRMIDAENETDAMKFLEV